MAETKLERLKRRMGEAFDPVEARASRGGAVFVPEESQNPWMGVPLTGPSGGGSGLTEEQAQAKFAEYLMQQESKNRAEASMPEALPLEAVGYKKYNRRP